MKKSLETKLAAIHADPGCREFIIADAKDADMALGHRRTRPVSRDALERGSLPNARGISRADEADHPIGPGRHHAHVGQFKFRTDFSGTSFRQLTGHAGRPGQRHK